MPTIAGPAQNVISDMNISQEGARRFVVKLSWTPRELPKLQVDVAAPPEKGDTTGKIVYFMMKPFDLLRISFLSVVKLLSFGMYASKSRRDVDAEGRDTTADQFDLDLDCYIFDEGMQLKCVIGTEGDALLIEGSKKVYHSGDDQSGMAGEHIFVETQGLPQAYQNFFFVVRSDCKYSLDQFVNPLIRLADGKTDANVLQNTLVPAEQMIPKAFNYAFCHVFRDGDTWRFRNLDAYQGDAVEWEMFLPSLVIKQAA